MLRLIIACHLCLLSTGCSSTPPTPDAADLAGAGFRVLEPEEVERLVQPHLHNREALVYSVLQGPFGPGPDGIFALAVDRPRLTAILIVPREQDDPAVYRVSKLDPDEVDSVAAVFFEDLDGNGHPDAVSLVGSTSPRDDLVVEWDGESLVRRQDLDTITAQLPTVAAIRESKQEPAPPPPPPPPPLPPRSSDLLPGWLTRHQPTGSWTWAGARGWVPLSGRSDPDLLVVRSPNARSEYGWSLSARGGVRAAAVPVARVANQRDEIRWKVGSNEIVLRQTGANVAQLQAKALRQPVMHLSYVWNEDPRRSASWRPEQEVDQWTPDPEIPPLDLQRADVPRPVAAWQFSTVADYDEPARLGAMFVLMEQSDAAPDAAPYGIVFSSGAAVELRF
jgi:hypothetical protein